MRFNSVGFALSVGMALIVVLFGFTLLSAAGLVGFAADDRLAEVIPADTVTARNGPTMMQVVDSASALTPVSAEAAATIAAGDALFKNNCAQCHAVNEQVVGPALGGITKRRPIAWLIPWVRNSSKVVAGGDDYAVALYNKFNEQQMPSFALSDKKITSIVAYITSQESQYVQAVNN